MEALVRVRGVTCRLQVLVFVYVFHFHVLVHAFCKYCNYDSVKAMCLPRSELKYSWRRPLV